MEDIEQKMEAFRLVVLIRAGQIDPIVPEDLREYYDKFVLLDPFIAAKQYFKLLKCAGRFPYAYSAGTSSDKSDGKVVERDTSRPDAGTEKYISQPESKDEGAETDLSQPESDDKGIERDTSQPESDKKFISRSEYEDKGVETDLSQPESDDKGIERDTSQPESDFLSADYQIYPPARLLKHRVGEQRWSIHNTHHVHRGPGASRAGMPGHANEKTKIE